ncbi:MAG: InlB B-repeat-containing protein [Holophagaceae bacterium]|nr:InlB B-repeat-containing protein [Holophagaceae bacterium]
MNRIFTLLVAVSLGIGFAPTASAQTVEDINLTIVTTGTSGTGWSESGGIIMINTAGNYRLYGTTTPAVCAVWVTTAGVTLTLDGANITNDDPDTNLGYALRFIMTNDTPVTGDIVLANSTVNSVTGAVAGINCSGNLIIQGDGSLTATGPNNPMSGNSTGIFVSGNATITGNVNVTAVGQPATSGSSRGIEVLSPRTLTIQNGATVTASAGMATTSNTAIYAPGGVTVTGGTLTATATGAQSYGITTDTSNLLILNSGTVTVSGETRAISSIYTVPFGSSYWVSTTTTPDTTELTGLGNTATVVDSIHKWAKVIHSVPTSLTWDSGTPPTVVNGDTVVVEDGADGTLNIPGGATVTITSTAPVVFSGNIDIGSGASLIFDTSNGNIICSGEISGPGAMTKTGATLSTLGLEGINSHSGNITVAAGTLLLAHENNCYPTARTITVNTGATLRVGPGTGKLVHTGLLANNGTLEVQGMLSVMPSGSLANNGTLTVDGTLEVNDCDNMTGNITNNGTVIFRGGTYGGVISGTGTFMLPEDGNTVYLSGINTYTGPTGVMAGTLHISGLLGGGNYAGLITIGSISFPYATLSFNTSADQIIGDVTNHSILAKSGTKNLTINGSRSGAGTYNYSGSGQVFYGPTMVYPSAPSAPTIGTATAGNALHAIVTFTPPASNGGSPITSYTVTSSPDGKTGTGTSSPITVYGLTGGTHPPVYTFRVTATNSIGTSPASASSNPITPVVNPLTYAHNPNYNILASVVGVPILTKDISNSASGGTKPYTFSATGLPAGITITTAGILSGTPTTAGPAGSATITVTDATSATASITITYGAIAPANHTITFDPNGGSVSPTNGTTGADGKLTSLPTPAYSGHTFDGWFTSAVGGTQVTTSTVFTANATIYAHWTAVTTYTLTVTSGTGSGEYAEGETVHITANAPPTGQVFKNWTSSPAITLANPNSASTSFTMPATPVTITANYGDPDPITVTITPDTWNLTVGGSHAFSAHLSGGLGNHSVEWDATGGTIDIHGIYTAPETPGSYTITATSTEDPSKYGTATVNVAIGIVVEIEPKHWAMAEGSSHPFTTHVTGGHGNVRVTWSATRGTITSAGVYTAPMTPGTYTITATSVEDPTKTDTATVEVFEGIVVDIEPKEWTMTTDTTHPFKATITGGPADNTGLSWTITPNNNRGTITSAGVYTAPSDPGTYTITATSTADPTKSDTATVEVIAGIVVHITPKELNLVTNTSHAFETTITGHTNTAVTWEIHPANGGTITPNGIYTAPAEPGEYVITAISVEDPTRSDSATVEVIEGIVISIAPETITLTTTASHPFTATLTGHTNTNITWTATGGTITQAGVYTAPAEPGEYVITATSTQDPTITATADIYVTAGIQVYITPDKAKVTANAKQTFTANITGAKNNTDVNWTITPTTNSGTIEPDGVNGIYTAPETPGTYIITATSVEDPTKTATATIEVLAGIVVSVEPKPLTLTEGASYTFTANVTGGTNNVVTWTATGGTITEAGAYTAPDTPGRYIITATSIEDPTRHDSAVVEVVTGVVVELTPKTWYLPIGSTTQFVANVTGNTNQTVSWSATGGTISQDGTYTAPMIPGAYIVTATSAVVPTKTDTAMAIVTISSIDIVAPPKGLLTGDVYTFRAYIGGLAYTDVDWEASVGTINPITGEYTAPNTAQTITITATSKQEQSLVTEIQVKITSPEFDGNSKATPKLLDLANAFGSNDPDDLLKYDLNNDGKIDDEDIKMLFAKMGW